METDFFFVYGTLKVGGYYANDFDKLRISSEKAIINNMNLYKISYYPGILPGIGTVTGELHEYKNPEIVIQLMDRIEGYKPKLKPELSLFKRKRMVVITEAGKEVEANLYIYNYKITRKEVKSYKYQIEGATLIKNGIWNIKGE